MNSIMNFNVFEESIESIQVDNARIINTINPHSYLITKIDTDFKNALQNSDVLLPDGIGIVWASKVLNNKPIKKIAGYDIFLHLMEQLNDTNGSCFFLGASSETLNLIKTRANKEYPNVKVYNYSPPYKKSFSKEDSDKMIREVNNCNPTVLFVGMTAPKQEKWSFKHKDSLNAKVICSIGAVFDFYAGTVKRPGRVWIFLGLEWLGRSLSQKRLAKRNLSAIPPFITEVIRFKLNKQ